LLLRLCLAVYVAMNDFDYLLYTAYTRKEIPEKTVCIKNLHQLTIQRHISRRPISHHHLSTLDSSRSYDQDPAKYLPSSAQSAPVVPR